MKHCNIYNDPRPGHGQFQDHRGKITDIFFGQDINHATIITNNPGAVRGNHYHKQTEQLVFIVSGSLEYYSQAPDPGSSVIKTVLVPGDLVSSPPYEKHAMRAGPDGCVFMAFARGIRGGQDYEADTFRVDSIIPQ